MKIFGLAQENGAVPDRRAIGAGNADSDVWSLVGASILWQDADVTTRSADKLFEAIMGQPPEVSLRNKVPTLTLPCRGLARGVVGGVAVEVTVQSNDYSTQITFNTEGLTGIGREPLERAVASAQAGEGVHAWRTLKLICRTPLMDGEAARLAFCRTTGIELAAAQVTSQKYARTERAEITAAGAGQFHGELELGAYPEPDGRSWLEAVVSASWTSGGGKAGGLEWQDLMAHAVGTLEGLGADPWA